MKKFSTALLLLLLGIIALFFLREIPVAQPPVQGKKDMGRLTVKNVRITDASAAIKYSIDVAYPQFEGLSDSKAQQEANAGIRTKIENDIAQFKQEVNTTEQGNLPIEIEGTINEFYIRYTVAHVSNDLISVAFSVMDYQAGMNHPNNYNEVYNYDLKQQKQLQLANIFKPGSGYLERLSQLSQKTLAERFKKNPNARDFITDGTKPEEQNFSLFTLKNDTVQIIFNPYQVAPYYEGTQVVTIQKEELATFLQPEFLPK